MSPGDGEATKEVHTDSQEPAQGRGSAQEKRPTENG